VESSLCKVLRFIPEWLCARDLSSLQVCQKFLVRLADGWVKSGSWCSDTLFYGYRWKGVRGALEGVPPPALVSLSGKSLVGAQLSTWDSLKPLNINSGLTSLQKVCLCFATHSEAVEVLHLPHLSVFDLRSTGMSPCVQRNANLEAPRLTMLLAPASFACQIQGLVALRRLLLRVNTCHDASVDLAELSSAPLEELHIIETAFTGSRGGFTLNRLFKGLARTQFNLKSFVYLRPGARSRADLFENTLLAFQKTVNLQSLRFVCISLNEDPARRTELQQQLTELIERAPQAELWIPDWPGEAPVVPSLCVGLFGSCQLGSWATRISAKSPPGNFEDLVYSRVPPLLDYADNTPALQFAWKSVAECSTDPNDDDPLA